VKNGVAVRNQTRLVKAVPFSSSTIMNLEGREEAGAFGSFPRPNGTALGSPLNQVSSRRGPIGLRRRQGKRRGGGCGGGDEVAHIRRLPELAALRSTRFDHNFNA